MAPPPQKKKNVSEKKWQIFVTCFYIWNAIFSEPPINFQIFMTNAKKCKKYQKMHEYFLIYL
jgi:hypothetical protein